MNKDEIVRAIRAQRRATFALLRNLAPERYDTPTALPGWRIREVVAHLVTTDRASVTGRNLFAVLTSMERVERWNDRRLGEWADRSVADLLVALSRCGNRFARFARRLPSALYRLPMPTMFGRAPVGLLLWARAFDEWVHRQDIRRALGMPDERVDVMSAAEFVLHAIGVNMRGWPDLPQGRVLVALEGSPIEPWEFDLAARKGGASTVAGPGGGTASAPAATISLPAGAFVMAASGRDSFDDLHRAGTMSIQGDEAVARAFLSNVRIV